MTEQLDLADIRPKLTVGILTLNEEKRIASCINSAKFADQILVIDSGSKDKTRDIAAALGAEVHDYPDWQGFAVQRNRVLQHAKGEYIFFLDADEEMPPEMQAEIEAVIASGKDEIWEVQWNQVAAVTIECLEHSQSASFPALSTKKPKCTATSNPSSVSRPDYCIIRETQCMEA
jgi:glycosyltransferase involved in cell wall biosynthesis